MSESVNRMNSEESIPGVEPVDLNAFRREIAEMKRKEQAGEFLTNHFEQVDVEKLTPEDAQMWVRCKEWHNAGKISEQDLAAFRSYQAVAHAKRENNPSSSDFAAFLGNRMGEVLFKTEWQ